MQNYLTQTDVAIIVLDECVDSASHVTTFIVTPTS